MTMASAVKAFAFDLDGTIYVGDKILDGAADLICYIQNKGMKVFYFTNSSTKTRQQIHKKLIGMGLTPLIDEIYTSAYATAVYVAGVPYSSVACVGNGNLEDELKSCGIKVTTDIAAAEALIIGLDTFFNYSKLAELMPFRDSSCPIIACNRDSSFPVENGNFMPGCGPIVAAVEDALGRRVARVVGKPDTYIMKLVERDWGVNNTDIIIVGDSYESDIEMAKIHGCRSFLISRSTKVKIDGTIVIRDISYLKSMLQSMNI